MPYIKRAERKDLEYNIIGLVNEIADPGELCYVICSLVSLLAAEEGEFSGKVDYELLSNWKQAIDTASAEFYRRVIAYYEDVKLKENGDVFSEILMAIDEQRSVPEIKVGGTD